MSNQYNELSNDQLVEELERLKRELRHHKKYGLVWEKNKTENVVEQCKSELPVLEEVSKYNIVSPQSNSSNIIIEGDNYHALSVLNYTHKGKIDVIYIDPPYNTGNKDFIYNDRYVDADDVYRHSKWLNFMSKRLELAKQLLSENGVMFISIDNNEIAQLKMLCDDLMPNGFVTTLHVQMSTVQGQKVRAAKSGNIVKNGEYILVYSKSGSKTIGKNVLYEPAEYDTHYSGFMESQEDGSYKEIGLEKVLVNNFKDELTAMGLLSGRTFPKARIQDAYKLSEKIRDFIHENSEIIVRRHTSIPVILTKDEEKKLNQGLILPYKKNKREYLIAKDDNGVIVQVIQLTHKIKKCHDFYESYGVSTIRGDWWPGFYLDMGNVSKEGGVKFDNGKKPLRLIKQLIYFASNKDSIILDFFAGSGTTGHAVLSQNESDGGSRRFILCTNNEGGIAEKYCLPRIKNVINGYSGYNGIPSNVKYFRTTYVSKSRVSDDTRRELVKRSTEMICLRENTFYKVADNDKYKIYKDNNHTTGILFDLDAIDSFKEKIREQNIQSNIYVFSLTKDTYSDDFDDLELDHELCPIPESILEVYMRLFK